MIALGRLDPVLSPQEVASFLKVPEIRVRKIFEVFGTMDDPGILRDDVVQYLTRKINAFGG